MTKKEIATGVVHKVPADLREVLTSDLDVLAKWNDLTPLARNEWICWTTSVKKPETRRDHVERVCSELKEGKEEVADAVNNNLDGGNQRQQSLTPAYMQYRNFKETKKLAMATWALAFVTIVLAIITWLKS